MSESNKFYLTYLFILVLTFVLWEISSDNSTVRLLISSPQRIAIYTFDNFSLIMHATYITFFESILGLLIATVFAFSTMVVSFYFPKFMDFILPIMVTSQVIPLITLAPLFIILFGVGVESKIMMAALLCFFPIFVDFASGVKVISINIIELMKIYNSSKYQLITKVYFPLALPNIISGLKIAATLSVIGAIVGEFNGTEIGLGKNLYLAARRLEPELMMASLFFSALLGGIMYLVIHLIEKKLGYWYLKN